MGRKRVPWRERYRVSRQILGQSFSLIASMRSYWVFPVLNSGLMFLIIALAFLFMLLNVDVTGSQASGSVWSAYSYASFALLLVLIFPVLLFTAITNSALAYGLYRKLAGHPVRIGTAWRRAWSQIGPIFRFTVVAFLVSLVLGLVGQILEKVRFIPGIGRLTQVVGTLGWTAASFFVIPIIMVDRERRAIQALRQSVSLARDNWGKSVSGIVTISLAIMVPMLLIMVPLLIGVPFVLIFLVGSPALMFPTLMVFFFIVIMGAAAAGMVSAAAQSAYQVGLYVYTKTGEVQPPFTERTLVDAWEPYRSS